MKGIVIVSPWFYKWFMAPWVSGIALFPFIVVRDEQFASNAVLINHEKIHIRQQLEMLIVFFYIWYVIEYLIRWVKCGSRMEAYKNISFEREAYANQHIPDYTHKRRWWNHLKWL